MDLVLPIFAEFGIPGLVIGYLLFSNNRKDERINELTDKFVSKSTEDAKRDAEWTVILQQLLRRSEGSP